MFAGIYFADYGAQEQSSDGPGGRVVRGRAGRCASRPRVMSLQVVAVLARRDLILEYLSQKFSRHTSQPG